MIVIKREENTTLKDNENENQNEENQTKNIIIDWAKSIIFAIIIAVFIKTFLFSSTYVLGNSMYPTLHEKDRLFSVKVSLYLKDPEREDIVIMKAPDDVKKDYIKRVIGVEGDTIEIIEGRVYVNKELLKEDYIPENAYTHIYSKDTWEVLDGEIFVLGDNREKNASKDSRSFGTVDIKNVKGITSFRYFPIFDNRFGHID